MIYIQLNLNHVLYTQWERAEPCPLFVPLSSYSDKHVESDGMKGSVVLPCIVISLYWASSSPFNIITQFSPKFPRPLRASIHSIIFTNPFMSTVSPLFLPFHSLNPQRFLSSIHSLPHNLEPFLTFIHSLIFYQPIHVYCLFTFTSTLPLLSTTFPVFYSLVTSQSRAVPNFHSL